MSLTEAAPSQWLVDVGCVVAPQSWAGNSCQAILSADLTGEKAGPTLPSHLMLYPISLAPFQVAP